METKEEPQMDETARDDAGEGIYASGAVVRLTGISAHVLRAWERRYGAVRPSRTEGGARRYSRRDIERLRLLRRAVEAGHSIGQVARLSDHEIARRLEMGRVVAPEPTADLSLDDLLASIRELDLAAVERVLSLHFATLGPTAFARDVLTPLLRRVGEEWQHGELSVAAEHAVTTVVRNLLGLALRRDSAARGAPVIFATPEGEQHELGVLVAAIRTLGVGGNAIHLGASVPSADLADAARQLGARAVALGVSNLDESSTRRYLRELRSGLSDDVSIWLGGRGSEDLEAVPGVQTIDSMEELERHVSRVH